MTFKKLTKSWNLLPEHVRKPDPFYYWNEENYVVLDFETTNIEFGDPVLPENSILCACWSRGSGHPKGGSSKIAVRGSEFDMQELVRDIEDARFLVAHNAKFELGWLKRCGLDLSRVVVWCTQLGEYVLGGNRPWLLSLEECAKRRNFGSKNFVGKLIRKGVHPEDIPSQWLEEYCHKDVELTEKLFISQRKDIYHRRLAAVNYTRQLRLPVLADIEFNGMCLDPKRVEKLYFDYLDRYTEIEQKLNTITGGINFKSSDQVAEYVYETLGFTEIKNAKGKVLRNKPSKRWPQGKPKTDKATMAKVLKQAKTKEQREFVELRQEAAKLSHALTNSLGKFQQCCRETDDNILYAKFNNTRTATHRLSSTGVKYAAQFQNFNNSFKPVFKARETGWLVAEHDQAQLEWRGAVDLCKDVQGAKDIAEGVDSHAQSAGIIFKDEWENAESAEERKAIRKKAKAYTFKPLYGGKYGTDSEMEYYKWFREKYSGISKCQDEWKNHVLNYRWLRIESGLIFYWPDAKLDRDGELIYNIAHQVCNYKVQSFCTADIVPISLVYQWHRMKAMELESFLVSTVHDSTLGEVKPSEKEIYDKIAKVAFENDTIKYLREVYNYNFEIPLVAEADFGTHWATSVEWEKEFLNE